MSNMTCSCTRLSAGCYRAQIAMLAVPHRAARRQSAFGGWSSRAHRCTHEDMMHTKRTTESEGTATAIQCCCICPHEADLAMAHDTTAVLARSSEDKQIFGSRKPLETEVVNDDADFVTLLRICRVAQA